MSIYSRDYMREGGPTGKTGGPSNWSVVTWLIIANAAFYALQLFLFRPGAQNIFALSLEGLRSFKVYQLLTFQFSHANLWHLAFNMLWLFFLGRMLLHMVKPRHVVQLYLLGGIVGGILELAAGTLLGWNPWVVGASASVMAIVFAVVALIPNQEFRMLFMFVIPIRFTMKKLALVLIALDVLVLVGQLIFGVKDGATAVFAHFGGMAVGWFYIRNLYPLLENRPSRAKRKPAAKGKKEKFGIRIIKDGDSPRPEKTGKTKPFVNTDVDAILDKISAEGMQSLTEEEKKILEKSSEKLSKKLDQS